MKTTHNLGCVLSSGLINNVPLTLVLRTTMRQYWGKKILCLHAVNAKALRLLPIVLTVKEGLLLHHSLFFFGSPHSILCLLCLVLVGVFVCTLAIHPTEKQFPSQDTAEIASMSRLAIFHATTSPEAAYSVAGSTSFSQVHLLPNACTTVN